jgi:nucleotidyltransferase/DNA polymerase involved in DNA repair
MRVIAHVDMDAFYTQGARICLASCCLTQPQKHVQTDDPLSVQLQQLCCHLRYRSRQAHFRLWHAY